MQYIRLKIGVILIINNNNNNFIIKHYIKKADGTISDLLQTGLRLIQLLLVLLGLFHSKLLVHGNFHMFILHTLYHIMRNRYYYYINIDYRYIFKYFMKIYFIIFKYILLCICIVYFLLYSILYYILFYLFVIYFD